MNKLFLIAMSMIVFISSHIFVPKAAKAATVTTKESMKVSTRKFAVNTKKNVDAFQEDQVQDITKKEKNLLARLVHAEAKGEPYDGKVAVAHVVLNRLDHEEFPDTVKEVIYEKNAFEPVQNGSINQSADEESHEAVEEALENKGSNKNKNLLYFYNPDTATSDWILTRKVVKKIGNHAFSI